MLLSSKTGLSFPTAPYSASLSWPSAPICQGLGEPEEGEAWALRLR